MDNISWRVLVFDVDGKRRADFPDRKSANEFFDEERFALADINDKVVLYRIKGSGSKPFQDVWKADILGPEGFVRVKGASPKTWQQASKRSEMGKQRSRSEGKIVRRAQALDPYYVSGGLTSEEFQHLIKSEQPPRTLPATARDIIQRRSSRLDAWRSGDPEDIGREFDSIGDALAFYKAHEHEVDLSGR